MAGIFFSCQNTMEEIESANDGSILPSQTIKNGSFDYTEKGKLLHRIASGEMNQFENEMMLNIWYHLYFVRINLLYMYLSKIYN